MSKSLYRIVTVVSVGLLTATFPANAGSPGFSDQTANAGVTFTHVMQGDTPGQRWTPSSGPHPVKTKVVSGFMIQAASSSGCDEAGRSPGL